MLPLGCAILKGMRAATLLLLLVACGDWAPARTVDAGPPAAGTFAKSGGVYVIAYSYPVESHTFSGGSLSASFVDAAGPAAGPACPTTTDGACTLSLCPQPVLSDAGAKGPVAAGIVTVEGIAGGPYALAPSGGAYAPVSLAAISFRSGESLTTSAPGEPQGAPAFTRAVKAPSYVFVSEPLFPRTGPVTIDRTKDLPIVWTAGTDGDTTVTLSGQAAGQTFLLQCTTAATAGKLTVPAIALGKLPTVTAAGLAVFSVATQAADRRATRDWMLYLHVSALGARPGGVASAELLVP